MHARNISLKVIVPTIITCFMMVCPIWAAGNSCIETRYTFDIGSGSTKLGVVKIDACQNKPLEFIKTDVEHVKFQKCLEQSPNRNTLTEVCIAEGVAGMKKLLQRNNIDCQKTDKCAGIATEWARSAQNADILLQAWRDLGVKITMISQKDEGIFAYRGAVLHPAVQQFADMQNVGILDVGAASFQVSTQAKSKVDVFLKQSGISSFKRQLDKKLGLAQDTMFYDQHNLPLALAAAVELIKPEMRQNASLSNKIKENKLAVFAVGRLFVNAFMDEMGFKNVIHKHELKAFAESLSGLTEKQVLAKHPKMLPFFAQHAQIAAILVYAIMEGLGVDKLEIIDARLFDYLAIDHALWDDVAGAKLALNSSKDATTH